MVQTRAEAARRKASAPKRRFDMPRDVAFGILVGIVVSGALWWLLAFIYRQLAG